MKNKSAFPNIEKTSTCGIEELEYNPGMTLRDYFAAKALNGLLASWGEHDVTDYNEIAHDAYMAADAMMKAGRE